MVIRKAGGVLGMAIMMLTALLAPSAWAAGHGGGGGHGGGSGGGPPPVPSSSAAFVKAYSNLAGTSQVGVTAEDVQQTSDGGYVGVATTASSSGSGASVSWLLKTSATGTPQWQEQIGCLSGAPGDYSIGVSLVQASDGGYVLGGGTVGCGSGSDCPELGGIQCALVEKVSSTGSVDWARVYNAGVGGSSITKIRQAGDGGLVAVGTTTDANHDVGGLVLKLDSQGMVQWQRQLGPVGTDDVLLSDVQQASDGGYVVAGSLTPHNTFASVFVARLDSSGNVTWQQSFNSFDSAGTPTTETRGLSIIQTSDGGYLAAGQWVSTALSGQCCAGALVLKLDSAGNLQWQKALSGGLYCFFNGFSETCANLAAVAYTAHQTSDGGYVLTGDETLKLSDSVPLEPWIGKVDSSGNLLWQHLYYQTNPASGRPLSENFSSSAATTDGGFYAGGFTENVSNGDGEFYAVKTDSSGLAGSACGDTHPGTTLNSVNPALTPKAPNAPVSSVITSVSSSPAATSATSVSTQTDC